jgi:hypothetical protein
MAINDPKKLTALFMEVAKRMIESKWIYHKPFSEKDELIGRANLGHETRNFGEVVRVVWDPLLHQDMEHAEAPSK